MLLLKALVLYAHPNPKSFNAAILQTVKDELATKGAEVKVKDLYAMNWNPVLSASDFKQMLSDRIPPDIARERADVAWADTIITIAPFWWFSVPAILKGYFDRVFGQGFAYQYTDQGPVGLLTDKKAVIITTSGADSDGAKQTGMIDSFKTAFVQGVFAFTGFISAKHHNCYAVPMVSDQQRQTMLEDVRQLIQSI